VPPEQGLRAAWLRVICRGKWFHVGAKW
jgi:hypothetical protein